MIEVATSSTRECFELRGAEVGTVWDANLAFETLDALRMSERARIPNIREAQERWGERHDVHSDLFDAPTTQRCLFAVVLVKALIAEPLSELVHRGK